MQHDLRRIEETLRNVAKSPGVEVIPYNARMMERSTEYGFSLPELKPYDQAVLATVVVRAEGLQRDGERDVFFCERDSDLQPWDSRGEPLEKLTAIYDPVNVWVCNDYFLENPRVPGGWRERQR